MIARSPGLVAKPLKSLMSLLALCSVASSAQAESRLDAHYLISMIGVTIGQISWTIDIGADAYKTSASGKASGALSILVNGEGSIATNGILERSTVENGAHDSWRLTPTFFTSSVTEDGEFAGLQMTFENGSVKTLRADELMRKSMRTSGRVPVSEANRRDVSDPLSAMIIARPSNEIFPAPAACDRVLKIFDGQRRYDLSLSFKRADTMKIVHGYAGPVLVCSVLLVPISGYRAGSMLVKYVGGQRNMEIWFAPMSGTGLIAPVRVLMPTMIGTLEIAADRFEFIALKALPTPAGSAQPRP